MTVGRLLFCFVPLCFLCVLAQNSGASVSSDKKGRFELIMSESAGSKEVEYIDFQKRDYESGVRNPSFLFQETISVRNVVGQLTLGNQTKSFVVFSEHDRAPVIWMRLKTLEELEKIRGLLSESPWADGRFSLVASGDDQKQAQVAEKSLPPTEGDLYAQLDFGNFFLGVKPQGLRMPGFKTELRGWHALEAILDAAKSSFKIIFLNSSVLRNRITRGLDLDTSKRIQFKKFFAEEGGIPKEFNFYEEAANGNFRGISDASYIAERENAKLPENEKRTSIFRNMPIFEIFYVAFHLPGDQKKPILGFFRVYPGSLDLHLILNNRNQSDASEIANEFGWLAKFSISQDGKTTSPGMERAMADLFPDSIYVLGFSFPLYRTYRHELITVEREAADIMTAVLQRNRGVLVDPKAVEAVRNGYLNDLNGKSSKQQICRLQLIHGE